MGNGDQTAHDIDKPRRGSDGPPGDDADGGEATGSAQVTDRLDDLPRAWMRYGPGRLLRSIAGCDENILRACPEERFKFSGFGAVVLGTASLAAVSMTVGLSIIFNTSVIAVVPAGLLWGLFILALDRWLVSGESTDFRRILPRLLIAVFFGFIIAEPMVLAAFDDAITESIGRSTASEVAEYEGELGRCNPAIADPLRPPSAPENCNDATLALDRPATPVLAAATPQQEADHARLTEQIGEIDAQLLAERQALADEIGGEVGTGLSGRAGDGTAAAGRRETIAGLESDRAIVQDELDVLNSAIQEVGGGRAATAEEAADAAATYNTERAQAVQDLVDERRRELSAPPGLARRMDELSKLMGESSTILFARLFLTLFFVVIDTAPAIIRMASSGGAYDTIRDLRTKAREDRERVRWAIANSRFDAQRQVELHRWNNHAAVMKKRLDFDHHMEMARIEEELDRESARQEESILADARLVGSAR